MSFAEPKTDKITDVFQRSYVSWDDDGSRNEEAVQMLTAFYFKLKQCKPDKKYECRSGSHMSYMRRLLQVQSAFAENKYMRACHEIIGLVHCEFVLQNRVKANLLALINDYLKIEA